MKLLYWLRIVCKNHQRPCGSCSNAVHKAEYEQDFLCIDCQFQRLQPAAQPEARQIISLLKDFNTLWQQMTLTERRAILQAMFAGLYFDAQNQLWKVAAHDPFGRFLDLGKKRDC